MQSIILVIGRNLHILNLDSAVGNEHADVPFPLPVTYFRIKEHISI